MKKSTLILSAWIFSICCVGVSCYLGAQVPFHNQWPLYEALRATAAIIFAVIGAWLAIIYPEKLRVSFGVMKAEANSGLNGLSALFAPIVHSTLILSAVLLIGVVAPLLRPLAIVRDHLAFCRGVSYGVLVALTLWQLFTVLLTLVPADIAKSAADEKASHDAAISSHLSSAQIRRGAVARDEG